MRRRMRAGCWSSTMGAALGARTRPAFTGDLQVPITLCLIDELPNEPGADTAVAASKIYRITM